MAKDWGVPDWRDGSAYPDPDQTNVRVWWWEFTRRRPDYRALWDGAAELEGHAYRYAPDVDDFRLRFELSLIHDPARCFTDWELMQFRYPINHARSPREWLLEQADHPLVDRVFSIATHRGKLAEDQGHMLYNFDLSHPLGPQLAQAEQYMKAVQQELFGKVATRRPRPGNWREFLRAIDGRDSGASFAALALALWPEQEKTPQSARDTHAAACKLRDNFPT